MKRILFLIVNVLLFNTLTYCCDTTKLDRTNWSIIYVDSEELTGEGANNGHAIHCLDGDSSTFWHTEWQAHSYNYPHEIWIDLGDTLAVNGFSILTRNISNRNGRIKDYAFYISSDTANWGNPQSLGQMNYPYPTSNVQQTASVFFGAVRGRYVRLVGYSSMTGDQHAMIAELNIYADTLCTPTGQQNQIIYAQTIERQLSTNPPFAISAYSSSGLPLSYEIVSGPATVSDSIVTLTGDGGIVTVRISQAGDSAYYPMEIQLSFEVINLNDYSLDIKTFFTNELPVEMPRLMPYLLHSNVSIQESQYLGIVSLSYSIGEETLETVNVSGDYQAWWTPSSYGTHEITVTAVATNGNVSTVVVPLEVTDIIADQTVQAFDSAVIDYGSIGSQWYYGSYELPQFVSAYNGITARLQVSCPPVSGGCDDWDRLAYVQVKNPQGEWVEIIRYITPFGKACNHAIDVTDFETLLQGKVEMRMYIDTWGTGGWQMDLFFDYTAGEPEYPYSHVETMWQGSYNFGDPANLQPVDTTQVGIFHAAQKAHLRLVTSGHGWGENNVGNAAEFYHAVHHLQINGEDTYEQDLWCDCYPNPDGCNNQHGTYKYDRAGWCPGSISQPFIYDITNQLWRTPFQLSYIFEPTYVDVCHPHNPDCVSGVTCDDCNASMNPFYRVSCYLIRYSDIPHVSSTEDSKPIIADEIDFSVYPNPCHGQFRLQMHTSTSNMVCTLLDATGKILRTYFFENEQDAENHLFNVTSFEKGVYFLQIYTKTGIDARKIIIN